MVTRSIRRRALAAAAAAALVAATAGSASAEVRASVDRDVVHEGDSVRLTLSTSGDAQGAQPDLAPLAADFEVLGTQQSHSVSIVNGRVDAKRELEVLLRPRRSGEVEIPALRVGDETSAPVTIAVLDAAAAPPAGRGSARGAGATAKAADPRRDAPDLFVEASVDQSEPFVQGEVRYTVRVYDGAGIREGALTEPEAAGMRVEPRGDTRTYERLVGGRRYVVHEREYALFPQESGAVTIPPVVLQARVADPRGARRSPFDDAFDDAFGGFGDDVFAEMFARMRSGSPFGSSLIDRMLNPGREVRVRSNAVELSVQGRPADAGDGWFLPARSVTLEQSWRPAQPTFRVGETVRRTIRVRAEGASAAQLPPLEVGTPDGVRQYPADAPQTPAPADGDAAEAMHAFDLVPTRAGTFTLPAVELRWWDVEARVARTATLPAQTIEVLPPAGARQADASPANAPAAPSAAARSAADAASGAAPVADQAADGSTASTAASALATLAAHPATLGAAAAALLLLVVLVVTWRLARRTRAPGAAASPDASPAAAPVAPRALVDALRQACAQRDARAARDALVAWGRAQWPDASPASPSEVARRLGHESFARAVEHLDDALYAPRGAKFDGDALWREFRAARKSAAGASHAAAEADELLPALYPSSRAV